MSIHRVCHENSISVFPSSGYAPQRDILSIASIASIIPVNTDCFPNIRYNHQSPSHLISHAHHLHVSPARNPPITPVFLHAAHCYRTYRTRRTCRPHAQLHRCCTARTAEMVPLGPGGCRDYSIRLSHRSRLVAAVPVSDPLPHPPPSARVLLRGWREARRLIL